MGAKALKVAPIASADARRLVKRLHYSGKVANNSQLHLGVFWKGKLEGAMQFGPSLDKRKLQGLVEGTTWDGFLELNRMAFSERLPRNSESRALAVALRMIRKNYPHIQWIVSFADGAQCGDGTIYRASGFVLTQVKRNQSIWQAPSGETICDAATRPASRGKETTKKLEAIISATSMKKDSNILNNGAASMAAFKEAGWKPIEGYQLRYLYFLDPSARQRLTCPILPFSKIDEMGAGMYKGQRREKQAMAFPEAQRQGSTDLHAPATEGNA